MGLRLPIFLSLTTLLLLLSFSHADFTTDNPIKLPGSGSLHDDFKINCVSFRVGVEANNLQSWTTIPSHCKNSIKSYVSGKQFGLDIEAVAVAAADFAESFEGRTDKLAWVFDLEETLLSNMKYLKSSKVNYGSIPIDTETYYEWLLNYTGTGDLSIQDLFGAVKSYDIATFIISEAPESLGAGLTKLLTEAGYSGWTELILKGDADEGKSTAEFKSEKRGEIVGRGYTIVGNVGDQWSDLSGENAGERTFKIPNPIYYIG